MKILLLPLAIWFLAGFQSLSAQQIVAGLTTGQNVIYTDPADIQLTCDILDTQTSYSLDIDQDGTDDLTFNTSYYYFSHLNLQGTQTDIVPNAITQISKIDSLEVGMLKHQFGDTISGNLNWSPAGIALFNSYSSQSTTEYFTNEGFVGFRICNTDTIYGWVHAAATGNYLSAQLLIYDYAHVAKPDRIVEPEHEQKISCSNQLNDDLLIKTQWENTSETLHCFVYDISARLLLNKELSIGENHLNISAFQSGVYLIVIQGEAGGKQVFKIIKR